MEVTQEYIKSVLHYDPETGIFTWRVRDRSLFNTLHTCKAWNTKYAGKRAGRVHSPYPGYYNREIKLKNRMYFEHHLAWLYVYGSFPPKGMQIDHINRIPSDNRISNLRVVTLHVNCRNRSMPGHNTSGVTGVTWHSLNKKWMARTSIGKKRVQLGYFDNIKDAERAVLAARSAGGYTEGHGQPRPS